MNFEFKTNLIVKVKVDDFYCGNGSPEDAHEIGYISVFVGEIDITNELTNDQFKEIVNSAFDEGDQFVSDIRNDNQIKCR